MKLIINSKTTTKENETTEDTTTLELQAMEVRKLADALEIPMSTVLEVFSSFKKEK